jgi:hypothetical protein
MVNAEVVARVGVTVVRYVTSPHLKQWLVTSLKVPKECRSLMLTALEAQTYKRRAVGASTGDLGDDDVMDCTLDADDKLQPITGDPLDWSDEEVPVVDLDPESPTETPQDGKPSDSVVKQVKSLEGAMEQEPEEAAGSTAGPSSDGGSSRSKRRKFRVYTRIPPSLSEMAKRWENIYFIPRLWRKPDGSLNWVCLVHQLQAIVSHVMMFPGKTVNAICDKFSPALQPVQTMELIEILEETGCVQRRYFKKSVQRTAFSKSQETVEVLDEFEADIVIVEPTRECVTNLVDLLSDHKKHAQKAMEMFSVYHQ